MDRAERFQAAMRRCGLNRTSLGKAVGVSQQAISDIIAAKYDAPETMTKIAARLGVAFEWLTVGDNAPPWAGIRSVTVTGEQAVAAMLQGGPGIPVDGSVHAGPGGIDVFTAFGDVITWPVSWRAVKVEGESAYPVIYPGQFAVIDEARAITPDQLDEAHGWDLDDDVVIVRLVDDQTLLKRFCYHPPSDFVLASVNGGRRSPLIKRENINHIAPVVSVIYYDPKHSRSERWKEKRRLRAEGR